MITVFIKEVLDNFRERRVIFLTLVLGPLLGPVLFTGLIWFVAKQANERMESALELPVAGAENAPNLIGWLERQGVTIEPPPEDPEAAVREEEEEVVLRIPNEFAEAWNVGRPAPVEIIADRSLRYSDATISRVNRYLSAYNRQIGDLRLQLRGVHPVITRPVDSQVVDLSTPTSRGGQLLMILPYFILMTVFMGSMHMAIDTTAGERERKSLEPLLINPLPRWQIMAGKLGATTFFALATLGLGLLEYVFAFGFLPNASMDIRLNLDFAVAAKAFLVVAPAALLAGALLTILASFAKSFREAQSYMSLVVILPMVPSLWLVISPAKAEFWMTLIPLLSQSIVIIELVRGEPVPLAWFGASIGSTLALALLLAFVAGSLYNRPKLIFTDG